MKLCVLYLFSRYLGELKGNKRLPNVTNTNIKVWIYLRCNGCPLSGFHWFSIHIVLPTQQYWTFVTNKANFVCIHINLRSHYLHNRCKIKLDGFSLVCRQCDEYSNLNFVVLFSPKLAKSQKYTLQWWFLPEGDLDYIDFWIVLEAVHIYLIIR